MSSPPRDGLVTAGVDVEALPSEHTTLCQPCVVRMKRAASPGARPIIMNSAAEADKACREADKACRVADKKGPQGR